MVAIRPDGDFISLLKKAHANMQEIEILLREVRLTTDPYIMNHIRSHYGCLVIQTKHIYANCIKQSRTWFVSRYTNL